MLFELMEDNAVVEHKITHFEHATREVAFSAVLNTKEVRSCIMQKEVRS